MSVPQMLRRVQQSIWYGGLAAIIVIISACASLPSAEGDAADADAATDGWDGLATGTATFAPLDRDQYQTTPESRFSVLNMVIPLIPGWEMQRTPRSSPEISARINNKTTETTGTVGTVSAEGPVYPISFAAFFTREIANIDGVQERDVLQELPDGSWYAGIEHTDGRAVRIRFFSDGSGVRYVAFFGESEEVHIPGVNTILAGTRLAREGEETYVVIPGGPSAIEPRNAEWMIMSAAPSSGLLFMDTRDSVALLIRRSEEPMPTDGNSHVLPLDGREYRVIGGPEEGTPDRMQHERYHLPSAIDVARGPSFLLELSGPAESSQEEEGLLIDRTRVQRFLSDQVWIEEAVE